MTVERPPIQVAFAAYFATWGLFLPDDAVAARADGWLLGEGWSVRWRWLDADDRATGAGGASGEGHPDGVLQFAASHRMTDLRWHLVAADGSMSSRDVPFEFMVFPKDATAEEKARIEAEYRAAWSAHGRALAEERMEPIQGRPAVPAGLAGPGLQTWCTEGVGWASAPLLVAG